MNVMLLGITMQNIKMKITRDRFNRVETCTMEFTYSMRFIHLVNKYLLNAYFVPGSIPGPRDSVVNKKKVFFSRGDCI